MPNAPERDLTDFATLARLFAGLEPFQRLALAVSGGPDSLSLMLLIAHHRQMVPRLADAVVLTVDHGLRPAAAEEARIVARRAAQLGFAHETLAWTDPKPLTGIQAAARAARYRLLVDAARRHGCDALVTAHTLDDQAETVLMALARGSGVYGLAAMPARRDLDGIALVRPLIGVAKAELLAFLARQGETAADDPSNRDDRYLRARLRRQGKDLAALGLTPERLAATAERMARAAEALDAMAGQVFRTACRFLAGNSVAEIRTDALAEAPEEIGLRVLSRALVLIGDLDHPPRLDAVEALRRAILAARTTGMGFKRTLGGVVAQVQFDEGPATLILSPELGRAGFGTAVLEPGGHVSWGPFRLKGPAGLASPVAVAALGASGVRLARKNGCQFPFTPDRHGVLAGQPGIFVDGLLVAVPTLRFEMPGASGYGGIEAEHRRRLDGPPGRSWELTDALSANPRPIPPPSKGGNG